MTSAERHAGIVLQPLTAAAFAPFGDVVERDPARQVAINAGRFARFVELAAVDVDDSRVNVSLLDCASATTLPFAIDVLERHPRGSQLFMPLDERPFIVAVAPAATTPEPAAVRAFVSDGHQGVNYRRGTWHMPLHSLHAGQSFLVIDYAGDDNCDVVHLDSPLPLRAPS